ncbi:diaminopimelate decarboxylase [Streptomyces sp. RB6PN25]|uniref:Diaminopimelate decarboxylase n=1 Tax=Streptomyces humicola TaxID=2953240 RepID=A0ABT1PS40_9ACTN|nr:diaminopimelate decarboxylase [Streptomyces humicola]MCQ4080493.1 diaminopimelate decarboxylase [Streptomyces humicola]
MTPTLAHDAAARRTAAVQAAAEQELVGEDQPVIGLLDAAGIQESAAELHAAFATPGTAVTHTFAVKAASLVPVLRLLAAEGVGCEVASAGELALARAAGLPADRIVFDSPAKTTAELRAALALGVAVNADNPQELARLDALVRETGTASPIGLRVNPQVGGGTIEALSTATATSKFGFALRDEGATDRIVRAYADHPWLSRLHAHTGSQGIPLELMAVGVRAAYELAERINVHARAATGRQQITTIDIGGGLPVNFASDEVTPTFRAYAELLRTTVPGLFDGRYALVTEFGRSLVAKHGTILARVEYTKTAGGRALAITHVGAQVATRTVFDPGSWPLRVLAFDAKGRPKSGEPVVQDVTGPCCFAGDIVAHRRELPLLAEGDLVALPDTGAYYFSTHYAYNSLPRPGIYGYDGDANEPHGVRFTTVRAPQTLDEIVAESGSANADALTGPR